MMQRISLLFTLSALMLTSGVQQSEAVKKWKTKRPFKPKPPAIPQAPHKPPSEPEKAPPALKKAPPRPPPLTIPPAPPLPIGEEVPISRGSFRAFFQNSYTVDVEPRLSKFTKDVSVAIPRAFKMPESTTASHDVTLIRDVRRIEAEDLHASSWPSVFVGGTMVDFDTSYPTVLTVPGSINVVSTWHDPIIIEFPFGGGQTITMSYSFRTTNRWFYLMYNISDARGDYLDHRDEPPTLPIYPPTARHLLRATSAPAITIPKQHLLKAASTPAITTSKQHLLRASSASAITPPKQEEVALQVFGTRNQVMKVYRSPKTHAQAMQTCLEHGSILAVESSDEDALLMQLLSEFMQAPCWVLGKLESDGCWASDGSAVRQMDCSTLASFICLKPNGYKLLP